jgi:hypothetical protein
MSIPLGAVIGQRGVTTRSKDPAASSSSHTTNVSEAMTSKPAISSA